LARAVTTAGPCLVLPVVYPQRRSRDQRL